MVNFWGHDFGGNGSVRARRPHRGRGAVGDLNARGDDKYHFVKIGSRGDKYYFTGEKDYKAIIYKTSDPKLAVGVFQPKKKKELTPPRKKELAPNKHGHNQFTPKDQMVKYGAPHKGVAWLRYKERLNTYLPKEPSPERMWEGKKAFTETEKHLAEVAARETPATQNEANDTVNQKATEEAESLWPQPDEQSAPKRRKQAAIIEDEADGDTAEMRVDEQLTFPYGAATNLADADDYPVSTDSVHRTKLQEEPDYFAQLLAEPDVTNGVGIEAINIAENGDSGSYASKLEAELSEAKKTIEAQKAEIDGLKTVNEAAKAKVTALEQEIATLKGSAEDMEAFINPEFFQ